MVTVSQSVHYADSAYNVYDKVFRSSGMFGSWQLYKDPVPVPCSSCVPFLLLAQCDTAKFLFGLINAFKPDVGVPRGPKEAYGGPKYAMLMTRT